MRKKVFVLLLIVAIICSLVAFVACKDTSGNNNEEQNQPSDDNNQSSDEDNKQDDDKVVELIPANQNFKGEEVDYSLYFETDGNGKIVDLSDYAIQERNYIVQLEIPKKIGDEEINALSINLQDLPFLRSLTIHENIEIIEKTIYHAINFIIIYCEATTKPNNWIDDWNPKYRIDKLYSIDSSVVWGCKENEIADDGKGYYFDRKGRLFALKDTQAELAFSGKSVEKDIELPNEVEYKGKRYSLTGIYAHAFISCDFLTDDTDSSLLQNYENLESIKVPKSMTSISKMAFWQSNINRIELHDDITSIGYGAFAGCVNLTSIEIPSSVTSIGNQAFFYCSSLTRIEIPSGVTIIGDRAFECCSSLTRIEIPIGVTSIGDSAFEGCRNLTSIEIPSGVTIIGDRAFFYCSSLTSIEIPSSVTSIGNSAFYGCSSLTGVYITDIVSWCKIEFGYIPNSLYYENITSNPLYYAHNLYLNNELVTELVIPNEIKNIRNGVFEGCWNLKSIEISSGVTSIGNYAFSGCSSLTSIEIPSGVTIIGDSVFSGCSSLASIEIPSGVTIIGDSAFSGCNSLTSIEIPSGVTSIGDSAFDCRSLTIYCEAKSQSSGWDDYWNNYNNPVVWNCNNNDIADDGNIYYVADNGIRYALKDGVAIITRQSISLSGNIVIPNQVTYKYKTYEVTVTSIGSEFSGCSSLTSIYIPSSVTSIDASAFSGCSSLTNIEVDVNNTIYKSEGNCIIEKDTNTLLVGCKNSVIPSYVTSIGRYAFYGCSSLTSIEIPSSVTSIGSFVFSYCNSLTSIYIPSSVTSIGYRAFWNCSNLTIYCEAESQPSDWRDSWNPDNCPVVWGYKMS